ncbi:MAG TPA: hypothetical protein VNR41_06400 [Xanthobacteraceae bacterium]|nr:hypothetical protein [Xanthobacteraceae bacterium]
MKEGPRARTSILRLAPFFQIIASDRASFNPKSVFTDEYSTVLCVSDALSRETCHQEESFIASRLRGEALSSQRQKILSLVARLQALDPSIGEFEFGNHCLAPARATPEQHFLGAVASTNVASRAHKTPGFQHS